MPNFVGRYMFLERVFIAFNSFPKASVLEDWEPLDSSSWTIVALTNLFGPNLDLVTNLFGHLMTLPSLFIYCLCLVKFHFHNFSCNFGFRYPVDPPNFSCFVCVLLRLAPRTRYKLNSRSQLTRRCELPLLDLTSNFFQFLLKVQYLLWKP